MTPDQFRLLLTGVAFFLAATIVVWGAYALYLILTGQP